MSGTVSSVGSVAPPVAMPRPAKVHFRFEFCQHGSNTPVATASITSTTHEIYGKHIAWHEFAQKQGIPVEDAKQQYTLRRKLS